MTGKTPSGQTLEMRLAPSEWVKLIAAIGGIALAIAGAYYKLDSRVGINSTQIAENKLANERTAESLAEVTRLVDRMSGREEARDERSP